MDDINKCFLYIEAFVMEIIVRGDSPCMKPCKGDKINHDTKETCMARWL